MEFGLIEKIKKNPKEYEFLKRNSYFYRYLNRNPEYYKEFTKAFKSEERNKKMSKTESVLDTLDTASSIIKIMK